MPRCTYCGGTEWFIGPSGGLSQNILCANKHCRHWFNYAEGLIFADLDKVEPTEAEKGAQMAAKRARETLDIVAEIAEGRQLFRKGFPIEDCFTDELKGYTAFTHGDAHRMAGYLQEQASQGAKR